MLPRKPLDYSTRTVGSESLTLLIYRLTHAHVIRALRGHIKAGQRVADYGCADARLLQYLSVAFPSTEFLGFDIDERLLQLARANLAGTASVTLMHSSEFDSLEPASLDIVWSSHVVEHIQEPRVFFASAYSALKSGGQLLFVTPNRSGLPAKIGGRHWRAFRDPTHISLHGIAEWSKMARDAGLEVIDRRSSGIAGFLPSWLRPIDLLLNIPLLFFGYLPWSHGDACLIVARKP